MIYLFAITIPFLLGRGALRAFYRKKSTVDFSTADSMVVGGMIVIGLTEVAHMGALILEQSFSGCVKLFLAGLVLLLFLAGILAVINRGKWEKPSPVMDKSGAKFLFLFVLLLLLQILVLMTDRKVYLVGDMTVETVNSMLTTDSIYQVNPMTGQTYTLGMPMRLKILCLPTFYAILCDVFGMSAMTVVWTVVPLLVLLTCYMAYYTLAKALFAEDMQKRWMFMIVVALILWLSNTMYGLDGFGVQYAGFRGVSIRMAILVPYTVGLVLRRKWLLVVLCVVVEACILWTFYGMGVCLLVVLGMIWMKRWPVHE